MAHVMTNENEFDLQGQIFRVGNKVRVLHKSSGESEPFEIIMIAGPHLTMRRIEESELGRGARVFPVKS